MVVKTDLPFVIAAHEASRRLGLPLEVAKEALRHAIRNREVIVCTPLTADGETTDVHIEDYSIDVERAPDAVVDAASFETWLIDRQPIRYERFATKMIGGNEARSLVEKAAGYDKEAAEQWLRRKMRVGCFLALQGAHDLYLEDVTTDTRSVTFVEIDAGIGLDQLSVATEALLEVLAAEFPRTEASPTSTSIPMPSAEEQRTDPESHCREWLESEMRKSPERSPKAKRDWRVEAQRRFPGLSARAFDRAWDRANEATGAGWSKAGRKSKR